MRVWARTLLVIFLTVHASMGLAHLAGNEDNCEALLAQVAAPKEGEADQITRAFNQFEKHFAESSTQFLAPRPTSPGIRIDYELKSPIWQSQRWLHKGEAFQFLNIGFKNLEEDSNAINRMVMYHLQRSPEVDLEIRYSPRRSIDLALLKYYRWLVHEAVLGKYRQVKSYLGLHDLRNLRTSSLISNNSDVFAVFMGFSDRIVEIPHPDKDLALTLQISYLGDRDFLQPSIKGVLMQAGYPPKEQGNFLPFEYRLPLGFFMDFRHKFKSDFDTQSICEFTRYAKFMQMPSSIQNRMLLEAFLTVRHRKMNLIVVSADRITERLFRRYGFQRFDRLPSAQNQMEEYLLYMRVDSDAFRQTISSLSKTSSDVTIERR